MRPQGAVLYLAGEEDIKMALFDYNLLVSCTYTLYCGTDSELVNYGDA